MFLFSSINHRAHDLGFRPLSLMVLLLLALVMSACGGSGGGGGNAATSADPADPADATISALTLSSGTLNQSFQPTLLAYTANSVYLAGTPLVLAITRSNANATMSVDGTVVPGGGANPAQIDVTIPAAGSYNFSIVVTSADGSAMQTYTLAVTFAPPGPPNVNITFPINRASAGNATAITVTGTAKDNNGLGLAGVMVNGVTATSTDGFATWRAANVPLVAGKYNTLEAVVTDMTGATTPVPVLVRRGTEPVIGDVIAIEPGEIDLGNIYALDANGLFSLFAAPLNKQILVSGYGMGSGTEFNQPTALAYSVDGNVLVADYDGVKYHRILEVNTYTGARRVISAKDVGDPLPGALNAITNPGGWLFTVTDMAVDAANNRALILDVGRPAIVAMDLTTGDLSYFDMGTENQYAIAIDATNNRALVLAGTSLLALNLTTAAKSTLASGIANPRSLARGTSGSVWVASSTAINEVNLGTGALTLKASGFSALEDIIALFGGSIIANETSPGSVTLKQVNVSTGVSTLLSLTPLSSPLVDPTDVVYDPVANVALISHTSRDLYLQNLATGKPSPTGHYFLPSDELLLGPFALAIDESRQEVVIADHRSAPTIIRLLGEDMIDGTTQRRVISGQNQTGTTTTGNGTSFSDAGFFRGMDIDALGDRAIVSLFNGTNSPAIYSIDLNNGNRTLLVNSSAMDGYTPGALAVDATRDRLVAVASDISNGWYEIFTIPLGTGPHTPTLVATSGTPAEKVYASGIAVSAATNTAYITTRTATFEFSVSSINLDTKAVTILTSPFIGRGPLFVTPLGIDLVAPNVALVADSGLDSLMAVELVSGDRVLLSNY